MFMNTDFRQQVRDFGLQVPVTLCPKPRWNSGGSIPYKAERFYARLGVHLFSFELAELLRRRPG